MKVRKIPCTDSGALHDELRLKPAYRARLELDLNLIPEVTCALHSISNQTRSFLSWNPPQKAQCFLWGKKSRCAFWARTPTILVLFPLARFLFSPPLSHRQCTYTHRSTELLCTLQFSLYITIFLLKHSIPLFLSFYPFVYISHSLVYYKP